MIEILTPQVANMIAAGEVVERPASAVKELIENAVDAGASAVTVELKRGGVSMIRVTDNGSGMNAPDAVRAFMRHATSKLRDAEDLRSIVTMGFRGEALAAIAAVSRIELMTRERGTPMGLALTLEAGALTEQHEAGCPEGTTIIIRDLFYNTPARQKFLKKDSTEAATAQEAVVRAALARPALSVRLLKDGTQALHTPGDGDLRNSLYSVFGSEFTHSLLPLPQGGSGIRVTGYIGSPTLARSARFMQYFFVNGRPVRNRTLTAALEESFSGALMTGRYPICAIHIEMPPETFDINVHPAKSEIKFQFERVVFEAVYGACREALRQAGPGIAPPVKISAPTGVPVPVLHSSSPSVYAVAVERPIQQTIGSRPQSQASPPQRTIDNRAYTSDDIALVGAAVSRPLSPDSGDTPPESLYQPSRLDPPNPDTGSGDTPPWRLIGEAMTGYLLVETSEALWIIDKHAAHERLLYNKLKADERPFLSQQLLTPRTIVLSGPERDILLTEKALLEKTGFVYDEFDPQTLAVRAAPGDIDESEIPALLSEAASLLLSGRRPDIRDEVLRTVACKAAVKLGRSSSRADMEYLAGIVMETPELRHCPHGRPVAVRLTRGELGRQFGR